MNETLFLLMYSHTARVALVALLVLLNIADLVTTYLGIKAGKAKEANPIAASALKKYGWMAMAAIKVVVIAGLIKWGVYFSNTILMLSTLFYAVIVGHNYWIYKK